MGGNENQPYSTTNDKKKCEVRRVVVDVCAWNVPVTFADTSRHRTAADVMQTQAKRQLQLHAVPSSRVAW
jgi:hypothetical protein